MARKVTQKVSDTKSELMTTTVQPTGNVQPVIYTHAEIKAIATQGFNDKHAADDLNGTATQRVAFACYAEWVSWRNAGHPSDEAVNDIDCILLTDDSSKAKAKGLKSQFVKALIDDKPDDFDQWEADAQAQWTIKTNARKTLLGRAMIAAAVVRKAGCSLNDFDRNKGMFRCKASRLIVKGVAPTGFLGSMILNDESVALNGGGYSGEKRNAADTGNMPVRIKANVDQLRLAIASHAPEVSKPAVPVVKVDLAKVKPPALAKSVPLVSLIEAVHMLLVVDVNKPTKLVARDAWNEKYWTMLSDIANVSDELQKYHTRLDAEKNAA